jgi:hypothetical protein
VLLLDDKGNVLIHPVVGRAKSPEVERRSDCMEEEGFGPYRSKSETSKTSTSMYYKDEVPELV